ncbi:thiamine-phosphate kinase [Adhaeretor mobilis]|uniref:Thiamine-monophosphate kinase n=1 Tax=Adhaeretor mobilis TaxID=1930276 RepID=A0A517MUT5_9BACT|nr:thiamine-phosphate kinase [Adhaeretor mobilis]QDS98642.1 Thiamine-monophosphate kinase [Adhaeretor mobilis]
MEVEFYQWLKANVRQSDQVLLGIGDDAAILAVGSDTGMVVTTDTLTDGVDFLVDEASPQAIGHKALGVNLSDLAALAAKPQAAVVSLVLPREGNKALSALELAIGIYEGLLPLAKEFDVAIAGGDTNTWDGPLVISVTAIGKTTTNGPLIRSGARAGDAILVTGKLGGSILGKHLAVQPRCLEALLLNERYDLHAGIDISDGLSLDVSRLAEASGCGVALDLKLVPIAEAAIKRSARSGRDAIDHALSDGEDFELILAAPPNSAAQILADQPTEVGITQVGHCVAEPGLWQTHNDELKPLKPRGYLH